jgi:ferric-dicitrate binding protein FerR (iron transport regulator)
MEDLLDALLFGDDLSSEDRSSIQDRLDERPGLAKAWAHWRAARRRVRDRLQERLPDRRLLVLYVLEQEGHADALTAREREALDEARDDLSRAIDTLPALEDVVERIRDEMADFEAAWALHVEDDEVLAAEDAIENETDRREPPERTDRAARPPRSRDDSSVRRWTRRLAVAAMVVALAVVATLFWPQGPSTTTVTVADGSVQVKTLEDGSTVRLVGPATLRYPTSEEESAARRVTLENGRAFFDVPRRDDASFVVETPTATATVLGTQFGVTTQTDTTEVVLATGSVRVEGGSGTGGESVVLEPGQHSRVAKGSGPTAPASVDLTGALEWTGLFVFRSVPLATIADRLSQQYDAEVVVAEALAEEPVTGTFEREQPVEEVLGALAATLGADVKTIGDNQYQIVPTP